MDDWVGGGEDTAKRLRAHLARLSDDGSLHSFLSENAPEVKLPGRKVHITPAQMAAIAEHGTQTGTWAGSGRLGDLVQKITAPSSPFKPRSSWGSGLRRAGGYTAASTVGLALEYMLRQRNAAAAKQQYEDYIKNLTK